MGHSRDESASKYLSADLAKRTGRRNVSVLCHMRAVASLLCAECVHPVAGAPSPFKSWVKQAHFCCKLPFNVRKREDVSMRNKRNGA